LNQQVAIFLLIYFSNKPVQVSSRIATAHRQDVQLCVNRNWYSHTFMLNGCWQQLV